MDVNELYHHGIKGMKWGVRRFQKADGSLTDAGRKRYGQRIVDGIKEKAAERKVERARRKIMTKPTSKLTEEELAYRIGRLNSEKMALTLDKDISRLSAKEVGAGRKFLGNFASKAVGEAAINAGRSALTKFFEKRLGEKLGVDADTVDETTKALKKEVEKLRLNKEKIDLDDYIKRGGKLDPNSDEAIAKAAKRALNEKLYLTNSRDVQRIRSEIREAEIREETANAIARAEAAMNAANQHEFITRGQNAVNDMWTMSIDDVDHDYY